ncbi:TPA: hypothetical protein RQO64_002352 [Klebsiella oxytoca]|nr:hypothetical protein [Klebsiella oxytoca]HDX9102727.1 hypothetical protein [Klebsiella oxytoca]
MDKHTDSGSSLVKAIKAKEVKELSEEYLELGVDALLKDETLKSLPLVKTVVSVCNFVGTVRDQALARKILRFINELSELNMQEREQMIDRLNSNDKYAGKVGDTIIELMDKLDYERKPEIAARFFIAYSKELLPYGEFRHCLLALEKVASFDIDKLVPFLEEDSSSCEYEESILLGFVNAGLAVNNGGLDGGVIIPTKLCKYFVDNALKS